MKMHVGRLVVCLALLSFFAGAASAQEVGGSIVGVGGTTFMSEMAPAFGAEVEGRVSRNVGIYGSVGRMQNALPSDAADAVEFASLLIGVPMSVKMPVTYGTGGVKFIAPLGSVEAYGLAGAGIAQFKMNMDVAGISLPTSVLEDLTGDSLSATKAMVEFGGGLAVLVGRARFDIGYRFGRPLVEDSFNMSRLQFGVGLGF